MSTAVNEIRKQIDQLDDKIHDLLMKRAEYVLKIGEQKKRSNIQVVQPDREIIMLRRLLARHQGPLPKEAVVRIWRELVGAVSLLQTGLKVAVTVPEDHSGLAYWDMAKDYFSSVLPMQKVSSPMAALAMVREGEATFGVMPWPEDNQKTPWWGFLMDETGTAPMRIVSRLPLGDRRLDDYTTMWRGLAVARLPFVDTGADRSFIALQIRRDISRGRVVEKAEKLGLKALSLYTCPAPAGIAESYHLMEIGSYVGDQDERLEELLQELECQDGRCVCLGGYPEPPVYEDAVGKGAEDQ